MDNDLADDLVSSVGHARQLNDGQLYMFTGTATSEEVSESGGCPPLIMSRASVEDPSAHEPLRDDSRVFDEALWADDASGAVIVTARGSAGAGRSLFWLPSDGGPALPLEGEGDHLRWGRAGTMSLGTVGDRALIGGASESVAVAEDRVYLSAGSQLVILEAQDPGQPAVLGLSPSLAGRIRRIRVAGDLAFAALEAGGMQIVDISDPAAPELRGHFGGVWVADVCPVQDTPYLVAVGSGLYVLDTTDPDRPSLAGSFQPEQTNVSYYAVETTKEAAYSLFHEGYAHMRFFGLHVLDMSDLTAPALITSTFQSGPPNGLALGDDRLYVAAGTRGLEIVDVSEPGLPMFLGSSLELGTPAGEVAVSNGLAYVAAWSQGLQIFDVNSPDRLGLVGELALPGQARGIEVRGDRVYIAADDHGLYIVDVADPEVPTLLGGYDIGWRRQ
jgi:hypothetical protein